MSKVTSTDNDFLHNSYDYFVGLYHRNVKFITFSAGIFFIALIIGSLLGYFLPNSVEKFLMTIVKSASYLHVNMVLQQKQYSPITFKVYLLHF